MRTKKFSLTLTTMVATSLAGCGPSPSSNYDWDDGVTQYADRDTAVCVDQRTKQRVPDSECRRGGSRSGWYYMGRNSPVPYYGQSVSGGTYNRPAGRTFYYAPKSTGMSKSAAISRGGLGTSSRSGFFSSGG